MKETKFIEQNQQKWSEYEQMLQTGHRDPEKLNDLFVQITDDLSYARTFYPNRSVKVYLNHMAQRIFHHIYKGKRFPASRLVKFWTDQLPQVMWESRRAMQLSLALFVLSFSIGVLSSIINPDFARVILGNEYVDMTLANIEKGDPMAVYKQSESFGMTAGIAANNLFVALKTAIFGVLASIGTAFMMIYNGIMVGAFQYFFIERGLFWPSFLTIWIHGTLEISAIIIAGGAGMTAGSGLLFPGTFSRTQAFQISMRRGLKIFIGIVPVIILAAFFEGFLTRFTETPDVLRGFFILASLAFILGYFVWLPIKKARSGSFEEVEKDADLPPDLSQAIDFNAIKTGGTIISDSFSVLKRHLKEVFGVLFASSLAFTLLTFWLPKFQSGNGSSQNALLFQQEPYAMLQSFWGTGFNDISRWAFMTIVVIITTMGYRILEKEMPSGMKFNSRLSTIIRFFVLYVPLPGLMLITMTENGFRAWLYGIFIIPMLIHLMASIWYGSNNIFVNLRQLIPDKYSIANTLRLLPQIIASAGILLYTSFFGIGRLYIWNKERVKNYFANHTGFLIVNFLVLLLFFINSEIWLIFIQFFSWIVPPDEGYLAAFYAVINFFTISTAFFACWLLGTISGALFYFSNIEKTEANHLHAQIDQVGTARQIRGLPKE